MSNFSYSTELPLQILKILNANKQLISETYSKETNYSKGDIEMLWGDLDTYLRHFNNAFDKKQELWNIEKNMYQKFEENSLLIRKNHGKVLICLPYNAVIPLLPIFLISFCVFGNNVILSPSRRTLGTAKLFLNILEKLFKQNQFDIELFEEGGQKAIDEFVVTRKVELLFFQGSSKNREDIYSKSVSNNVELIYEGEGNQISIVDNYISIEKIEQWLSFCNGKLCTTPKILFINNNLYNDFSSSIQSNLSLYNFLVLNEIDNINNIADNNIYYAKYNSIEDVVSLIKNKYDYGLQVSVFSENSKNIIELLVKNLNISRITINMNPTFQNSLLPWGGYKKSGYSRVSDFFDKATKTVIIENKVYPDNLLLTLIAD